ncbi:hypothetical protein ACXYTJ_14545 [Gilvimarinus sp. F26214L]|uniref:hypothetical protein n=1 Tax=Gilvimarinus sp. DZF01 TaxID=3461371 RepID=UPI0040452204
MTSTPYDAPEALQATVEEIIASGVLGRSKVYGKLLRYLADSAARGSAPKEIEIAIDVLGRDTDFDVAKDSAVRVYIHQLRKKIDNYYEVHAPDAPHRLTVPKGEYTVALVPTKGSIPDPATDRASPLPGSADDRPRGGAVRLWGLAIGLLLAANLAVLLTGGWERKSGSESAAAGHSLWRGILEDETPILVVTGDYYIFGELDEAGNVKRMVRDFGINSRQDLDNLFAEKPELGWQYYDLNLSYLPEGTAFALNSVLPLLHSSGKRVTIKMMSELTTRDLQSAHVVYVGYVSALDRIRNMVFTASNLRIGENYDQLINTQSGVAYTSDAGLPSFDEPFNDYGWVATLPSTGKTRVVVIAGMRDAGLIHAAQAVSDRDALARIDERLPATEGPPTGALEAIYRVRGLDRMNFNAKLEYAGYLSGGLWDDRAPGF